MCMYVCLSVCAILITRKLMGTKQFCITFLYNWSYKTFYIFIYNLSIYDIDISNQTTNQHQLPVESQWIRYFIKKNCDFSNILDQLRNSDIPQTAKKISSTFLNEICNSIPLRNAHTVTVKRNISYFSINKVNMIFCTFILWVINKLRKYCL